MKPYRKVVCRILTVPRKIKVWNNTSRRGIKPNIVGV